jgi:hypothetical protein
VSLLSASHRCDWCLHAAKNLLHIANGAPHRSSHQTQSRWCGGRACRSARAPGSTATCASSSRWALLCLPSVLRQQRLTILVQDHTSFAAPHGFEAYGYTGRLPQAVGQQPEAEDQAGLAAVLSIMQTVPPWHCTRQQPSQACRTCGCMSAASSGHNQAGMAAL